MDDWMKVFIVAMSAAVLIQVGILFALYMSVRKTSEKVTRVAEDFQRKTEPILDRVQVMVDDVQPRLSAIVANAAEISELARGQAHKADRVLTEAVDRLRLQVIRADQILTGALETVEETGTQLRRTVWAPVQRMTAVVRGIQAGLEFFRGSQPGGKAKRSASSDEELFI
jgi:hypothetical protein